VAASLTFELIGKAASAIDAFKKTGAAAKSASGETEKTTGTFAKLAGAVATGFAVTKVVDFAKESVAAASAAKVANKQLEQSFRNAGDSTGTLAKHAEDLAEAFGRQTGIQPTLLKQAEGILATFQNVSSATGVQSGVFDRATKAAADLAAAGFGDLSTNAKTLGKALNDPVKYMGTLSRSGIALTKTQQDNIKKMVEQGNLLGAQKQLLSDVEGRVGGMATTTATAGAKASVAYEQMKEKLGTALLPAVKNITTALTGLFQFVSANSDWLLPLVGGIAALVAGYKIWTIAQAALNIVMDANPVVLIVVAVVALIAAIVLIATKTQFFQSVWAAMSGAVMAAWNAVWNFLAGVFSWIAGHWPLLLAILTGPFGLAVYFVITKWSTITGFFAGIIAAIGRFFAMVFGYITAPFITAYNAVVGWLSRIPGYVSSIVAAVGRFFSGVYSAVVHPFEQALAWIAGVPGKVVGFFAGLAGQIGSAIAGVFNAIIGPFQSAWSWIQDHIFGPLRSAWNGFAHIINSISISTPGLKIAGHEIIPAFHWTPPWHIPTLAQGGLLTRSGLVYAHAGEVISPAPAAAAARTGPLVSIDRVEVSETVDVDLFAARLAWRLRAAGV